MVSGGGLDLEQIRSSLAELDQLSRDEYRMGLEEVLIDHSPKAAYRLPRLTGIVLKREFADQGGPPLVTFTGALHSWPWKAGSPKANAERAPKEYALLNQLRMPGPWNRIKPLSGTEADQEPVSWEDFKKDADNERGLFKVVALYVEDRLKGKGRKTFREYFEAEESPRFEAGLDLAMVVFDSAVTAPLLSLLGLPTIAVALTLIGVQQGYRILTETTSGSSGDAFS